MRKTRSMSKHEPMVMLANDRKSAIPQDFDMQSQYDDDLVAYESLKQAMCGWSCRCLLTRLNCLLAGITITLLLYVLSETTLIFESVGNFFTGSEMQENAHKSKSLASFLKSHHEIVCMLGPLILMSFVMVTYMQKYASDCSNYHGAKRRTSAPYSSACTGAITPK